MGAAGTPGGFFITFEGPEGAGKSTQVHRLAASLAAAGHVVWTTREPGGTKAGEMIRPLLLGSSAPALSGWTEALLFSAARAQLVEEVIRPRLANGEIVLCDRFSDSTLAYQGYGRGLDLSSLRSLQVAISGELRPGLTFLLNLPVRAGLARIPSSSRDRLDRETVAFHERVADGYRQMALSDPDRWREVDAAGSPDTVATAILNEVLHSLRQAGIRPVERRSA